MDISIHPGKLHGNIIVPPSKSIAHRVLICAALSNSNTQILCTETNQDIEATIRCLKSLGARIDKTESGYSVDPIMDLPKETVLDCGESGSTLRFLLPVVGALGVSATIHMSGRLPERPLSPLWEELIRMGCSLRRSADCAISISGKLKPGEYRIPGNVSSQFISGLLFALPLLHSECKIIIEEPLESKPYVALTQKVLREFGIQTEHFVIPSHSTFITPGIVPIEADWSNGAFFAVAKALGNAVHIENLNTESAQGDRAIMDILKDSSSMPTISAADIPDLIPILAIYFAAGKGVKFTNIARLRLKESDRVLSVQQMLKSLGISVIADHNTMEVFGGRFKGGIVNSYSDHRIAMAAAIAATVADEPISILNAECVSKSYPAFWQVYCRLGGKYEQYIR